MTWTPIMPAFWLRSIRSASRFRNVRGVCEIFGSSTRTATTCASRRGLKPYPRSGAGDHGFAGLPAGRVGTEPSGGLAPGPGITFPHVHAPGEYPLVGAVYGP